MHYLCINKEGHAEVDIQHILGTCYVAVSVRDYKYQQPEKPVQCSPRHTKVFEAGNDRI